MNSASGPSMLKGFPKIFWVANGVELLERAAYYSFFIVITLYLSRILGFSDVQAAWLSGSFSAGLFLLPTFTGAIADKIGFQQSLMIAFALLTIGYAGLAIFPSMLEAKGLVDYSQKVVFHGLLEANIRWTIIPIMVVIMVFGLFSTNFMRLCLNTC